MSQVTQSKNKHLDIAYVKGIALTNWHFKSKIVRENCTISEV